MPQKEQFQIPQELRHLAEENVERARQLYLNFMDGVEQTMAIWSAPNSGTIPPGFNEVAPPTLRRKTPMPRSNSRRT